MERMIDLYYFLPSLVLCTLIYSMIALPGFYLVWVLEMRVIARKYVPYQEKKIGYEIDELEDVFENVKRNNGIYKPNA